MDAVIRMAA